VQHEAKDDSWDNAVAESFLHTLKLELIHGKLYNTRQEAKTAILNISKYFITDNVVILISTTSAR
jgi:transposase InsO family protein